jgi:hypothetical protein
MWSLGMILHKILFFRLPYHYASDDADADGNPGGGMEDGEKMAHLEQEIQSYSGLVLFRLFLLVEDSKADTHAIGYQVQAYIDIGQDI